MRFLIMHKSNEQNEAGVPPSKELVEEMGKLMEESTKAGVLLAAEGVHPSSKGARVRFSGGKRTVTDGPFAEAKEVVGGYAIYEVASKEEAIEASRRFMELHREHWPGWEGEIEIRPLFGPPDVGPGQ